MKFLTYFPEMSCDRATEIIGIGTVESVDTKESDGPGDGTIEDHMPTHRPGPGYTRNATYSTSTSVSSSATLLTSPSVSANNHPSETSTHQPMTSFSTPSSTALSTSSLSSRPSGRPGNVFITRSSQSMQNRHGVNNHPAGSNIIHQEQEHVIATSPTTRPSLVQGAPLYKSKDIIIKNVLKHDNAIVIIWDTHSSNVIGFRVIYRLFGDTNFKPGPHLDAKEREFTIKNVPPQVYSIILYIKHVKQIF